MCPISIVTVWCVSSLSVTSPWTLCIILPPHTPSCVLQTAFRDNSVCQLGDPSFCLVPPTICCHSSVHRSLTVRCCSRLQGLSSCALYQQYFTSPLTTSTVTSLKILPASSCPLNRKSSLTTQVWGDFTTLMSPPHALLKFLPRDMCIIMTNHLRSTRVHPGEASELTGLAYMHEGFLTGL